MYTYFHPAMVGIVRRSRQSSIDGYQVGLNYDGARYVRENAQLPTNKIVGEFAILGVGLDGYTINESNKGVAYVQGTFNGKKEQLVLPILYKDHWGRYLRIGILDDPRYRPIDFNFDYIAFWNYSQNTWTYATADELSCCGGLCQPFFEHAGATYDSRVQHLLQIRYPYDRAQGNYWQ